jgi:hypothetical protein
MQRTEEGRARLNSVCYAGTFAIVRCALHDPTIRRSFRDINSTTSQLVFWGAALEGIRDRLGHYPQIPLSQLPRVRNTFLAAAAPDIPESRTFVFPPNGFDVWGQPIMVISDASHYLLWSAGEDCVFESHWAGGSAGARGADWVYGDGLLVQFPWGRASLGTEREVLLELLRHFRMPGGA